MIVHKFKCTCKSRPNTIKPHPFPTHWLTLKKSTKDKFKCKRGSLILIREPMHSKKQKYSLYFMFKKSHLTINALISGSVSMCMTVNDSKIISVNICGMHDHSWGNSATRESLWLYSWTSLKIFISLDGWHPEKTDRRNVGAGPWLADLCDHFEWYTIAIIDASLYLVRLPISLMPTLSLSLSFTIFKNNLLFLAFEAS